MKRDVATCLDRSTVTEAAARMRDRNVGFLPVCSADASDGRVVGAITDRDITTRVLALDYPLDTLVADTMMPGVVACRPDDAVEVAEDQMRAFQKSRIVCLDDDERLVGVISLSDIAKHAGAMDAGALASSVASREAPVPASDNAPARRRIACRDVMSAGVLSCRHDDRVTDIAMLMREGEVGFLPVTGEDGAIIGALTDRDLVIRVVAERRAPSMTRASDVLTRGLVYCMPDADLGFAEALMTQYKTSRVVCADDPRHPRGVVSFADVARVEPPETVSRVLAGITARDRAA